MPATNHTPSALRVRHIAFCLCSLLSLSMVPGCVEGPSHPDAIICPGAPRPAISVIVRDDRTGARAPFSSVRVVARSITREDSSKRGMITREDVAQGRAYFPLMLPAGTYAVIVSADGYRSLLVPRFNTVNHARCGAFTDTLIASLKRL